MDSPSLAAIAPLNDTYSGRIIKIGIRESEFRPEAGVRMRIGGKERVSHV